MCCLNWWQADIDNSGTIDYGEFLAATLHMNKLEREENLVSAFSFFDKDGSGYITVDELSQACREFGLDDVHLDDMIKEIDQDNVRTISVIFSGHWFLLVPIKLFSTVCLQDGQIDYNEFAAMMRKGNGEIGRRTMRNSLRINLGDALKITER